MLRITGQCILFIILASCSGYLFGRGYQSDTSHVILGGPKNLVMHQYLKSVPLRQFRKQVQGAKSHFDIFRIFLKDKESSDSKIYDILVGQSILNNHNKKRGYDYEDYTDNDYMYLKDEASDNDLSSQAYQHYNEVFESEVGKCKDPRPEVVHVPAEDHRLFFPDYTILHRCRNVSGCCWDEKQECGVKSSTVIERPFLVLHLHPNRDVIPDWQSVTTKQFINHTECECKVLTPLPVCDRYCPFPFVKQRPGEECICDCLDDNAMCRSIKQGFEPLGEEEFECVKEDRCMKPNCQEGEFVMEKGYCPGLTRASFSYDITLGDTLNNHKHKHRHNHGQHGHRKRKQRDKHRTK